MSGVSGKAEETLCINQNLIVLLPWQTVRLVQVMRVFLIQQVAPFIILPAPRRISVFADERQRQAPVVAVVKMNFSRRCVFRLHLFFQLLHRQPALRKPRPAFTAHAVCPGFWLAAALALLACSDAIRRISTHPLWRWLLHMQIAIIPLWLLYSGTLNDLSLMKEYANRQDVFDDALAQHLTLLFGAVLPTLVIGVPLGIWCYFSTARQGAIFSLLNVIQTVPSVALFGLLIAPLAALVTAFPWLGKLGIAGTGMTPALIALVLYALLPLVRGVVVGLNQIPRDVLERCCLTRCHR